MAGRDFGVVRVLTGVQNIKAGLDGHAASWYADVFDLVFPNVDPEQANALWAAQLQEPAATAATPSATREDE